MCEAMHHAPGSDRLLIARRRALLACVLLASRTRQRNLHLLTIEMIARGVLGAEAMAELAGATGLPFAPIDGRGRFPVVLDRQGRMIYQPLQAVRPQPRAILPALVVWHGEDARVPPDVPRPMPPHGWRTAMWAMIPLCRLRGGGGENVYTSPTHSMGLADLACCGQRYCDPPEALTRGNGGAATRYRRHGPFAPRTLCRLPPTALEQGIIILMAPRFHPWLLKQHTEAPGRLIVRPNMYMTPTEKIGRQLDRLAAQRRGGRRPQVTILDRCLQALAKQQQAPVVDSLLVDERKPALEWYLDGSILRQLDVGTAFDRCYTPQSELWCKWAVFVAASRVNPRSATATGIGLQALASAAWLEPSSAGRWPLLWEASRLFGSGDVCDWAPPTTTEAAHADMPKTQRASLMCLWQASVDGAQRGTARHGDLLRKWSRLFPETVLRLHGGGHVELLLEESGKISILPRPGDTHVVYIFSVDALIGAGKTTLLEALRAHYPHAVVIVEPVDEWVKNGLLKCMYEGTMNAAVFQLMALSTKAFPLHQAMIEGSRMIFVERCASADDHMFTPRCLPDTTSPDYRSFKLALHALERMGKNPRVVRHSILLEVSADVARSRVLSRGRDEEADRVTREMLGGDATGLRSFMASAGPDCTRIDASVGQADVVAAAIRIVESVVSARPRVPCAVMVDANGRFRRLQVARPTGAPHWVNITEAEMVEMANGVYAGSPGRTFPTGECTLCVDALLEWNGVQMARDGACTRRASCCDSWRAPPTGSVQEQHVLTPNGVEGANIAPAPSHPVAAVAELPGGDNDLDGDYDLDALIETERAALQRHQIAHDEAMAERLQWSAPGTPTVNIVFKSTALPPAVEGALISVGVRIMHVPAEGPGDVDESLVRAQRILLELVPRSSQTPKWREEVGIDEQGCWSPQPLHTPGVAEAFGASGGTTRPDEQDAILRECREATFLSSEGDLFENAASCPEVLLEQTAALTLLSEKRGRDRSTFPCPFWLARGARTTLQRAFPCYEAQGGLLTHCARCEGCSCCCNCGSDHEEEEDAAFDEEEHRKAAAVIVNRLRALLASWVRRHNWRLANGSHFDAVARAYSLRLLKALARRAWRAPDIMVAYDECYGRRAGDPSEWHRMAARLRRSRLRDGPSNQTYTFSHDAPGESGDEATRLPLDLGPLTLVHSPVPGDLPMTATDPAAPPRCQLRGCDQLCYELPSGMSDFCCRSHAEQAIADPTHDKRHDERPSCSHGGCRRPCHIDSTGKMHEFCGKSHAKLAHAKLVAQDEIDKAPADVPPETVHGRASKRGYVHDGNDYVRVRMDPKANVSLSSLLGASGRSPRKGKGTPARGPPSSRLRPRAGSPSASAPSRG